MLFLDKLKQIIFNEKIKSNEQIENEVSLKTIVEIPLKEDKNFIELITHEKEKAPTVKAFKKLITNIQFLCVNKIADKKVMLVTSPEKETGKSYVVANMAISFAEIGKKVLIIDTDMLNGRQDKIFNVPNNLGLSNYLSSLDSNGIEINEFLSKFINETAIKNVNLITTGTVPPNPDELLESAKLLEMIKDAKVFFDIILIDSSEVLNRTESLILAKNAASTIIVVSAGNTRLNDLEKAKKDIQNVGGKILGVILNEVKLKKEKKTKEQRKQEYINFILKIKEEIKIIIEKIKTKIYQSNQKLLEEATKQDMAEKNTTIVDKLSEPILNLDKKDDKNLEKSDLENELPKEESETPKVSFVEMLKNIKFLDKKVFENQKNEEYVVEEKNEEENSVENTAEDKEEIEEKSKEENNYDNKDNQAEAIEEKNEEENEPKKYLLFFIKIKEVALNKMNIAKEKVIKVCTKCKEECINKYNYLKEINKKPENENNNDESKKEIVSEKKETLIEEKEILNDSAKNEKMVLIIVDAEKGYCRVFSKDHFTERLVRGLDKKFGYSKAHYSLRNLRRKKEYFIDRYQLTEAQIRRIDVLIYDTLKDYDEYLWIERKMLSDKAKNYVLAITKEFERNPGETEKEYKTRCQRLRKAELEKVELDIEYKLDRLWVTTKINVIDKIQLSKFSKFYEIDKSMKNDSEIMRSKKNKKFYADIISGAEKKLEKANEEKQKKEETEKQVIEEDRKIKQEELKFEQQQFELEKRAAQERIKLEQENVRAEKKAEQERIKDEKRKEREIEKIERKEENFRRKKEKQKQKEELKFQKEREKMKQREEAKLEEELLVDNLYPKTKNNKNL